MARNSASAASSEEQLIAGRYRVERLLGKGGMGAVFAAFDTITGARVAIKRTLASASPKVRELFRREFHTLHGLRHPNIIEVYDYGSDADGLFYTMELLEGGDLGAAAPLPWQQVCSYLRQVAALLGLLHARRLLHRDIGPRNVWVLPDGRLKLIDFGALCAFGIPSEVVGTPPFIAPEWLSERSGAISVDQRADLYALGALAYWLLTSTHAFPARAVSELPRLWAREPAPPSSLAKLLTDRALPPIPPELDQLVSSLLRREPAARPPSTESLIARLDAIAGPGPEPVDHALRGYIRSKAFVGRGSELQVLEQYVRSARAEGRAILIEGPQGAGRSRLLEELSVRGRLAGTVALLVGGSGAEHAYGVANAIALRLLDNLPSEALIAARPHAALLARLSPELQRRLGVASAAPPDPSPHGRQQLQETLSAWLMALSEDRKLLLLVDDLERSDEESTAWLASLARSCGQRQLLLVAALGREPNSQLALPVQMFSSAALQRQLAPLQPAETHELLRSVFGPVAYLERVSETLHRVSQGNPAHCMELVEHLVEHDLARFSEGMWSLPGQLADENLPRSRAAMHAARLARTGEAARSLAARLSVHEGRLTRADCLAVAESSAADAEAALVELALSGVLEEREQGYGFAHESVRESLLASLTNDQRKLAHAKLGAALLVHAADPIDGLRAALHLLQADDTAHADPLVRAAVTHLLEGNRSRMHVATPLLEQTVALYRAARRGPETLAAPLTALAVASFFVDRRLADRYGIAAVETLEELLCFPRARALGRMLGPKLALYTALAEAAVRLKRKRSHALNVPQAMRMLLSAIVSLGAVATSSLDLAMTERYHRALEPLSGLGEDDVIGFVRLCTLAVTAILTENYSETLKTLREIEARIVHGSPSATCRTT